LRKLLDHQAALVVDQGKTHLNHAVVMNEVGVFSDILKQTEVLTHEQNEPLVDRLIQMYEGYLFDDEMALPGVIGSRENLHLRFLSVIESYIHGLARNNEYARCELICLQVLKVDALAESICFSLLKIYKLMESTIKMHRLYEQYRLTLLEQHAVAPSKQMQQLVSSNRL